MMAYSTKYNSEIIKDINIDGLETLKTLNCKTQVFYRRRKAYKSLVKETFNDCVGDLVPQAIKQFNQKYDTKFSTTLGNGGVKFLEIFAILDPNKDSRAVFLGEIPGYSYLAWCLTLNMNVYGSGPLFLKDAPPDQQFLPDDCKITNMAKFGLWDNRSSGDVTDEAFKKAVANNKKYHCDYLFSDIGIGGDTDKEKEQNELVRHMIDIIINNEKIGTYGAIIKLYKMAKVKSLQIILKLVQLYASFVIIKPEASPVTNDEVYLICQDRLAQGKNHSVTLHTLQKTWMPHYLATLNAHKLIRAQEIPFDQQKFQERLKWTRVSMTPQKPSGKTTHKNRRKVS